MFGMDESSERRLLRHKARLRGLSGPTALQVQGMLGRQLPGRPVRDRWE